MEGRGARSQARRPGCGTGGRGRAPAGEAPPAPRARGGAPPRRAARRSPPGASTRCCGPERDRRGQPLPAEPPPHIHPAPLVPGVGMHAARRGAEHRRHVDRGDGRDGEEHGPGVVSLGVFHLGGEGPRVVEAGVVPHGQHEPGDPGRVVLPGRGREGGARRLEPAGGQRERSEDDDGPEGREEEQPQHLRPLAHLPDAERVPAGADPHQPQAGPPAGPADGDVAERRPEPRQVADHERRVDGEADEADHRREPALLKPPEATQPAGHPDGEAAGVGQRRAEFTDEQPHGQAPEQGHEDEEHERSPVAVPADDLLGPVRVPPRR